jgi:hypothetical protein
MSDSSVASSKASASSQALVSLDTISSSSGFDEEDDWENLLATEETFTHDVTGLRANANANANSEVARGNEESQGNIIQLESSNMMEVGDHSVETTEEISTDNEEKDASTKIETNIVEDEPHHEIEQHTVHALDNGCKEVKIGLVFQEKMVSNEALEVSEQKNEGMAVKGKRSEPLVHATTPAHVLSESPVDSKYRENVSSGGRSNRAERRNSITRLALVEAGLSLPPSSLDSERATPVGEIENRASSIWNYLPGNSDSTDVDVIKTSLSPSNLEYFDEPNESIPAFLRSDMGTLAMAHRNRFLKLRSWFVWLRIVTTQRSLDKVSGHHIQLSNSRRLRISLHLWQARIRAERALKDRVPTANSIFKFYEVQQQTRFVSRLLANAIRRDEAKRKERLALELNEKSKKLSGVIVWLSVMCKNL